MRTLWMFIIAAALALASASASAKRLPPKAVAPVAAKGVIYKVPHWGLSRGREQNGGFVQAWDGRTKRLLWERMVYRIIYDPDMETDVQDVFITKIRVQGNRLVVTNEASERFERDLQSGRVRALTPVGEGRAVAQPKSQP